MESPRHSRGGLLSNNSTEDSHNILPVLLGTQGDTPVRKFMLQQTASHAMSIRHGQWKLLDHQGSLRMDRCMGNQHLRPPDAPGQLYDLDTDPGETDHVVFSPIKRFHRAL